MSDLINELRIWADQCGEPPDGCRRRAANEIERLKVERDEYRKAAEVFRDFGEFQHVRREYDIKQLARAQQIMTGGGHE